MTDLLQHSGIVTLWYLDAPIGPEQLQISSIGAREFLARGNGRYVETLPHGVSPGPKSGANRTIIDPICIA